MLSAHSNADCVMGEKSFKENYLNNFPKYEVFFVKGVALEVYEYGRTVKVIEDLKGNFDDESFIFVWGAGFPSEESGFTGFETNRCDLITLHQEKDTLIMLLGAPVVFEFEEGSGIEAHGDYATIECAYSVLKLSNGLVTGRIFPAEVWEVYPQEITMSWEELQTSLNTTAIQSVKVKNNIYQQNGTIFFENSGNKVIKLSFYDLSGKLMHEEMTTSNSCRPALAGNIFVCKINMDDEVLIIKYMAQ